MGYFTAQLVKVLIEAALGKGFSISRLVTGNGGMPSSHSTTVCSLATIVGFEKGLASFEFAICVIFAIVVMTDASGVRNETGKQAVALNEIIAYFEKLKEDIPKPDFAQRKFKELIGHTPFQVQMGALLGIIVGLVVHCIW